MIGYRVSVVVLMALLTACVTCSHLFPLFRLYAKGMRGTTQRSTYYYWYTETASQSADKSWVVQRSYTRDSTCALEQAVFVSAAWLAVAAAAISGLATLCGAAWVFAGYSVCLGIYNFLLTVLAFCCATAAVGLMAYAYRVAPCAAAYSGVGGRGSVSVSPFEGGYAVVEGFVLLCVAAGGFLVMVVVQAVGFCCGCQVGTRPAKAARYEVPREPVEGRPLQQRTVLGQEVRSSEETYVSTQPRPYRVQQASTEPDNEGLYPYPAKDQN